MSLSNIFIKFKTIYIFFNSKIASNYSSDDFDFSRVMSVRIKNNAEHPNICGLMGLKIDTYYRN
jgi:hypothetical protein